VLSQGSDDARCQVPQLGRRGAVGRSEEQDPPVFAQHFGLVRQVRRKEGREGLLHRNKSAHPHAYCFQLFQGIQKEADALAMHNHGSAHRRGER
jgi:hypothetical protein